MITLCMSMAEPVKRQRRGGFNLLLRPSEATRSGQSTSRADAELPSLRNGTKKGGLLDLCDTNPSRRQTLLAIELRSLESFISMSQSSIRLQSGWWPPSDRISTIE